MSDTHILLIAFSIILGYAFLRVRVSALFQPLRLELADLGEELLACETLDTTTAKRIEFILKSLFSAKTAWLLTVLYSPITIRAAIKRFNRTPKIKERTGLNAEMSKKLARFQALSMIATLANSPAALLLFAIQVIVGQLLFLPIRLSFGAAMDATERTLGETDRILHRH